MSSETNVFDRLARTRGVVLAHREEATATRVNGHIGMAHVYSRRDRPRLPAAVLPVQALVFEVGEPNGAAADGVLAASVFVHASSSVETRRVCRLQLRSRRAGRRRSGPPRQVGALTSTDRRRPSEPSGCACARCL